jgi:hypothetical protein
LAIGYGMWSPKQLTPNERNGMSRLWPKCVGERRSYRLRFPSLR